MTEPPPAFILYTAFPQSPRETNIATGNPVRRRRPARTPPRRADQEFRLAFEMARDAIFWADARTGRLINCNKGAERLLGAPRSQILGKHQTWLHPPELRKEYARMFASHLRSKEAAEGEAVVLTRDGRRVPVHISAGSVRIGDRRVIQGVFRDISARKRLESELERNAALLRAQQELSLDGILVTDTLGHVLSFNRRFSDMWEIPDEVMATGLREKLIAAVLDKLVDPKKFLARLRKMDRLKQDHTRDELALKDGRVFERYGRIIGAREGTPTGRVSFFRDVTAGRLSLQRKALSEREQMQRTFVASVSHELRTPIAAILGFAETLREGGLEDRANRLEFVRAIERHGLRLSGLVEDILSISALETGKAPLKLKAVALADIAATAVEAVSALALKQGIAIKTSVPPGLRVRADAAKASQILINLLQNAVKHNRPSGWVELAARAQDAEALVRVVNPGRGIPADERERVFEPFYRGRAARRSGVRGTGLGLAIAKELVELHGGRIWVESPAARQCAFLFTLPLAGKRVPS